jgi:hypothetical protein
MPSGGQSQEAPALRRVSQTIGVLLLAVAHLTALVVGGYPEWPTWAVAANFVGLVLILGPTLLGLIKR